MSRFVLDTNAVIALLKGDCRINDLLIDAEWAGISVITKLEYLSFPDLTAEDVELFSAFERRMEIIPLTNSHANLLEAVIRFRNENQLKLPDAIIAASAYVNQAILITADRKLLQLGPDITLSV